MWEFASRNVTRSIMLAQPLWLCKLVSTVRRRRRRRRRRRSRSRSI
ncbi:Protein of unknown function, partial [Gryllus bimaculatus]